MSRPTPGPWEARKDEKGRWHVGAASRFGGKGATAGLSVLWDVANGRPQDGEAAEANAHLIAQAPAMRKALEALAAFQFTPIAEDKGYGAALAALCQVKRAARVVLSEIAP